MKQGLFKWLFLVFVSLVLAGLAVLRTRHSSGTGPQAPVPNAAHGDLSKGVFAIERQTALWDSTIWSSEVRAGFYERPIIELWNNLRGKTNALSLLNGVPFQELTLPTFRKDPPMEHGLQPYHATAPPRTLKSEEWRRQLRDWISAGYELDQSEWRHTRFDPTTLRSVFQVTAHVQNRPLQERYIIRGDLEIAWLPNQLAAPEPAAGMVNLTNAEILARVGAPIFSHVLQITLNKPNSPIDPELLVYDLDGDGYPEILLPTHNQIFWNQGGGRFRPDTIHPTLSTPPHCSLLADFDGDGLVDLLCASPKGLELFRSIEDGGFAGPQTIWTPPAPFNYAFAMTAADVDGDGDLDLWIAQYKQPYVAGQIPTPYFDANDGFPSYLLLNENGVLRDATESAGLGKKRFRRTYSASFVDLNSDAKPDLLVVSDFAGVDLYYNRGDGHFGDVTEKLRETHAFGMSHSVADFDGDGRLDFLVVGMNSPAAQRLDYLRAALPGFEKDLEYRGAMTFGNRLYLRRGDAFAQSLTQPALNHTGWAWGAAAFDFDNDEDPDIYITNGHKSRKSVEDYESRFWRHDIYLGNSAHDPAREAYFRAVATRINHEGISYGGYDKNRLLLNRSNGSFLEIGYLAGAALEEDSRNVVATDLDGDGRVDLLVITDEVWPAPKQTLHVFRNVLSETNHWVGFRFPDRPNGISTIGTFIVLDGSKVQIKQSITGDSFRSQQPNIFHFGAGKSNAISNATIHWPNGRKEVISKPQLNQYHVLKVPQRDAVVRH